MKIYVLYEDERDERTRIVATYSDKTKADAHLMLQPGLEVEVMDLDPELPPHETVTRYEVWIIKDWDNPTFRDVPVVIQPGTTTRGHSREGAFCFWSYISREDALALRDEFAQSETFNKRLYDFQIAVFGRAT